MDLHSSIDELLSEIDNSQNNVSDDNPKYNNTLYKKWFKS